MLACCHVGNSWSPSPQRGAGHRHAIVNFPLPSPPTEIGHFTSGKMKAPPVSEDERSS